MIKGLALTHEGLEEISAKEIKQIIKCEDTTTSPGKVIFSAKDHKDLAELTYKSRTLTKVLLLLSEFEFENVPKPTIKNLPFIKDKIIVLCERKGTHPFTSADMEKDWSLEIAKEYNAQMDYKKPGTVYFLSIENNKAYFGVDFSGIDLGRRDFRIFLGAEALKGTIAAGILDFAGFESKHKLLDPFCRQGIIPIEAALIATNTPVHKFSKEKFTFCKLGIEYDFKTEEKDLKGTIIAMDDNFKNVSNAQKNAKIAGIVKSVDFSRTDLDWLDAKFGKNFLDRIVTYPPQLSKMTSEKTIEKIYHQLFYQAEFILKKTGKICVVMKRGIDIIKRKAQEFNFKIEKELKVKQGEEELNIFLFTQ